MKSLVYNSITFIFVFSEKKTSATYIIKPLSFFSLKGASNKNTNHKNEPTQMDSMDLIDL